MEQLQVIEKLPNDVGVAGICRIFSCENSWYDIDGVDSSGCEYSCTPPETSEECDGVLDEDCDGTVDEGCSCTNGDIRNCGSDVGLCHHGTETCTSGAWSGTCVGDVGPVAEVCDPFDHDCDGQTTNGFDLMSDENNCGFCGNVCNFDNAGFDCDVAVCTMRACFANWYDIDSDDSNGCEYACVLTKGGIEECDGVDNDCDGVVDDGLVCQVTRAVVATVDWAAAGPLDARLCHDFATDPFDVVCDPLVSGVTNVGWNGNLTARPEGYRFNVSYPGSSPSYLVYHDGSGVVEWASATVTVTSDGNPVTTVIVPNGMGGGDEFFAIH